MFESKKDNLYDFGKQNENLLYDKIKSFFDKELQQTQYKYDNYDYKSNNMLIELKTRKCLSHTYESLLLSNIKIINYNKYHKDKKLIIIASYIDKLMYVEYNKQLFDTFKKSMLNNSEVIYIPLNLFNEIK